MPSVEDLLLRVTGDSASAEQKLQRVAREVADLGRKRAVAEVQLSGIGRAEGDLNRLKLQLDALDLKKVKPEVVVEVERSKANLAILERELATLYNQLATKRRQGEILDPRELTQLASLLQRLGRESGNVGRTLASATGPANNLNGAFSGMLGGIKQLNPILQGVALVLLVSMVPAILALISAIGSLIVSIGVLVTAFTAALGPAVILLMALIKRISAIVQAYQQRKQALNSETRKSAAATQAEAQAAERLHDARLQLRDADEAAADAAKQLRAAQDAARKTIEDASQRAGEAAQNLRDQTVAAYKDMRDSIEAVKDAQLDLAEAQLGIQDSKLAADRAKQSLKDFAKEAGVSAKTIDGIFSKFQNVDFTPKNASALVGEIDKAAGGLGNDQQLELRGLVLDLAHAKLGEKEATDRLHDSQTSLNDAQAKAADYAKRGIAAYKPYTDAITANTVAQREANRLEREGVNGSPGVIAAKHALRDADQRAAEAAHNLATARKDVAQAQKEATGPDAIYAKSRARLSDAERHLLDVLIKLPAAFRGAFGGGTDKVINAIADALDQLSGSGDKLRPFFTALGGVFARNVRRLTGFIKESRGSLVTFGLSSLTLSDQLGRLFIDFLRAVRNIAVAVMPDLLDVMEQVNGGFASFAKSTSDTGKLRSKLRPIIGVFKAILGIVRPVGSAIITLLVASAPAAKAFVGYIGQVATKIGDWAKSKSGRDDVQKFFKETLPMVQSVVAFVGKVGLALLQMIQFFAPAIKFVVDGINLLLDVLNFVLHLLNKIPAPIRALLGFFVGGAVEKAFGTVLKIVGRFSGSIGESLGLAVRIIRKVGGSIVSGVERIGGRLGGFIGRFFAVGRGIANAIKNGLSAAINFIGDLVKPIIDKAKSIAGGIVAVFRGIKGLVFRALGGITDTVRSILNGVVDVLNWFIDKVNSATPGKIHIPGPVPDIPGVPDIPHIPKLATGGVASSSTLAEIGERGREAVLPLQGAVLRSVARAIVGAMRVPTPTAFAGAGGGGFVIQHQDVHLPAAPGHDQLGDPRVQAQRFAEEMKRRGAGVSPV